MLIEDENKLILRFNALHIQSSMSKSNPNELALIYTQAMMAFLIFVPKPAEILIVGLGGGSLSKFCHYLFPEANVTTVEINQDVISYRRAFHIPEDGERFRVEHQDASEYMKDKSNVADVILLDGYDEYGIPDSLCSASFYGDCHSALRDEGVLVANFNCRSSELVENQRRLRDQFQRSCVVVPSRSTNSEIGFYFKNDRAPSLTDATGRAADFQLKTGLPLRRLLELLVEKGAIRREISEIPAE